ncbi:amidohydrolase [Diaphorobacter sp. HDW4A]|nr:amidohydrolase [Diaphorobacter sp. HDW4A]QIL78600.1 amidohydrolase [Diaphorobacter sp. HDW4A]
MTAKDGGGARIFVARKILTMNAAQPAATHVAVQAGKIAAVGTEADMAAWPDAERVDRFKDKVLMPGLIEAHSHLMEGAMWDAVYLGYFDRRDPDGKLWKGLRTLDAVLERLKEAEAQLTDASAPLLGWGFDPILFGTARLSVNELDTVSATRPIVVMHASVHLMNVNSAMLAMAGIDEDTDIDGIHKDTNGQPTGELQEFAAMFPVQKLLGKSMSLAAAEQSSAIWKFGRVAQLAGVTTATDLVSDLSDVGLQTLHAVTADDAYPMRVVPAFAPQRNPEGGAGRVLAARQNESDKLRFGPVKFIVDGSIQGFTARLRNPGYFGGQPNGLWLIPPSQLLDLFTPFHAAGLQLHIHTNGDEATEVVLDVIEEMLQKHPREDHRHTLQHCQLVDREQLERAAKLGMCINFFSNHLYYWGDAHATQTVGTEWAARMNPAETARRLGITFSMHSDAPITPLNPLFTAWCAANRVSASGRVLGEAERLSVDDALHAVTMGAAKTLKLDHLIGSIEAGKFADFAVLEQDPSAVPASGLKDVPVWGTVLGGRVFEAPAK